MIAESRALMMALQLAFAHIEEQDKQLEAARDAIVHEASKANDKLLRINAALRADNIALTKRVAEQEVLVPAKDSLSQALAELAKGPIHCEVYKSDSAVLNSVHWNGCMSFNDFVRAVVNHTIMTLEIQAAKVKEG